MFCLNIFWLFYPRYGHVASIPSAETKFILLVINFYFHAGLLFLILLAQWRCTQRQSSSSLIVLLTRWSSPNRTEEKYYASSNGQKIHSGSTCSGNSFSAFPLLCTMNSNDLSSHSHIQFLVSANQWKASSDTRIWIRKGNSKPANHQQTGKGPGHKT